MSTAPPTHDPQAYAAYLTRLFEAHEAEMAKSTKAAWEKARTMETTDTKHTDKSRLEKDVADWKLSAVRSGLPTDYRVKGAMRLLERALNVIHGMAAAIETLTNERDDLGKRFAKGVAEIKALSAEATDYEKVIDDQAETIAKLRAELEGSEDDGADSSTKGKGTKPLENRVRYLKKLSEERKSKLEAERVKSARYAAEIEIAQAEAKIWRERAYKQRAKAQELEKKLSGEATKAMSTTTGSRFGFTAMDDDIPF